MFRSIVVFSQWIVQMGQMVLDGIEKAFAKQASSSDSTGSPTPPGRYLGMLRTEEEKEMKVGKF